MAQIIDLGLLGEARRILEKLLDRHGIAWFLSREGVRLLQLDPSKIDLVVRTAGRARERRGRAVPTAARDHCRQQIRRDLIRHATLAMLSAGC